MDLILRILLWAVPIGFIVYLVKIFKAPEVTRICSDALVVCLSNAASLPWYEKWFSGCFCVMKNIGCVVTAFF